MYKEFSYEQQFSHNRANTPAGEPVMPAVQELADFFAVQRGGFDSARLAEFDRLEQDKQSVLKELSLDLQALERNAAYTKNYPGGTRVSYQEMHGAYVVAGNMYASKAELLTDCEWGVFYNLDQTVDRDTRREYMVEMAKYRLRSIVDRQTIAQRVGTHEEDIRTGKSKAFSARETIADETRPGILAEKMVRLMLKKAFLRLREDPKLGDKGYAVEEAGLRNDVDLKIDFIIQVPKHRRGVSVDAPEGVRDIGVQFTTATNTKVLAHKQRQIRGIKQDTHVLGAVEDVVLVQIPMDDVLRLYQQWKEGEKRSGKKPGGPDALWDQARKVRFIREVLARIVPPEDLEIICRHAAA